MITGGKTQYQYDIMGGPLNGRVHEQEHPLREGEIVSGLQHNKGWYRYQLCGGFLLYSSFQPDKIPKR